MNKDCILIIDDDFINRELLKNIFSSEYTFAEAENGKEGLLKIKKYSERICAVILDLEMPEMTGLEMLEKLKDTGLSERLPIFLITAYDDVDMVERAYELGVMDVVLKPVTPVVIQRRVKTVIELFNARRRLSETVKGQEIQISENEKAIDELHRGTIEALATAIEFRDIESGQHVSRIYGMTKYILLNTPFGNELSSEEIEGMARGAIMHDVGKIAISDIILNKPGKLTKEEFEIMKQHTVKGAVLLEKISNIQAHPSYRYASDIARHHHERWDGKGYPDGLAGDEISLASQVVSIVDVYDALVSERVYKKAVQPEKAVEMIKNGECGIFNPYLLECFLKAEPEIRKWYSSDVPEDIKNELESKAEEVISNNGISNSVLDVMLLMAAMQNVYDMMISVNLTKNTYYMIDYNRFLTHCADEGGVFDELIEVGSLSVPVSHRQEFKETFCRESLIKAFYEGKKTVKLEHPQYSDDGTRHWVLTRVLFMQDAKTGDIIEITLSRYIDDEYKEKEHTRKILTDALNLAERANSARYDFLSKMSHDIRTPLNAIIGMSTIIAANLDNREKVNDCLVKIGASSKHLLGIINDILDLSKIEGGNLSLNISDFNIRDMIADISEEISFRSGIKRQRVKFDVSGDVAQSYIGDEMRIRQILENLLDNAYKYTPDGGEYSLCVRVESHNSGYDILSFSVDDNGVGIKDGLLAHLFEPFVQDESVQMTEGVGLGLSIAQNLAHLMNGDLSVTSKIGKGSHFILELPLEIGNLTGYSEVMDNDIKVLVVDDEEAVCEHATILLKKMGIVAKTAYDGYGAIEMVKRYAGTAEEFDVAVVDWKMPGIDGIETVREVRKIAGKKILVVVMSAYDWSEIEEEARAAGVDLFISKPILETGLRNVISCSEKLRKGQSDISFNGEKVLLVEDNELNCEVAKAILEMKNLKVDIAVNGKEAVEMFKNSKKGEYLAILMDILMPVMDGYEATKAVRALNHPDAQAILIYAMSANAFQSDITESKLSGMDGHIAKPVDFDEVTRVLKISKEKK